MTEIKFRYVFRHRKDGDVQKDIYTIEQIERKGFSDIISSWKQDGYELIARDLFTGVKDKKDNEIYEGDIMRAIRPDDPLTFIVKWYEYGGTNLLGINTTAFEIIGNLHQHPHLLEGKE